MGSGVFRDLGLGFGFRGVRIYKGFWFMGLGIYNGVGFRGVGV